MRANQVAQALEPLCGMILRNIVDCDRQTTMDLTLEVIAGWTLAAVSVGPVSSPDHPGRVTDVHLRFRDGETLPEFALSMKAADVYRVRHRATVDGATAYLRTEILFRRGHMVAVELV